MSKENNKYTIEEHSHRFAVWTAARAATRGMKGGTTQNVEKVISDSDLQSFLEIENTDNEILSFQSLVVPNSEKILFATQNFFHFHLLLVNLQRSENEKSPVFHTEPFFLRDLARIQTWNLLSRNQMRYSVAPRGLFWLSGARLHTHSISCATRPFLCKDKLFIRIESSLSLNPLKNNIFEL